MRLPPLLLKQGKKGRNGKGQGRDKGNDRKGKGKEKESKSTSTVKMQNNRVVRDTQGHQQCHNLTQ